MSRMRFLRCVGLISWTPVATQQKSDREERGGEDSDIRFFIHTVMLF